MIGSKKKELEDLQQKLLELEAQNKDLKYELDSYKWQMEEINKQEEEIRQLTLHGADCVSLGPRILRTETAGLAALCALLTVSGDME